MKKLFFAIVCAVSFAGSVFAENLYSFVPADSQVVVTVDTASILRRPEAVKVLNDPEVMAKQLEFSSMAGCSIRDLKTVVVAVGNAGNGVILFEMSKKVDVAAALKNLNVKTVAVQVGKNTVYQGEQRSAISQINDNIVIVGSPEDVKNALSAKQGMSEDLTALAKPFFSSSAVAWMVFESGKSLKGSASYGFCGKDKADHCFAASFIVGSKEEAAQVSSMIPMYAGMFTGMVFAQNPELGAKIVKELKVKTSGSKVMLSLNIPAAMADEISSYAVEQGKKSIKTPAAEKSEK